MDDAFERGKVARKAAPRASHAVWRPPHDRPDPIDLLERDDIGRLPELLPIRYRRMSASPFAFYRGAASIMASDVQAMPSTGIRTQICGDAHLANFGAFASPERRVVFDVDDFDETIEGCFEWDVKRLCASVAILAGDRTFRRRAAQDAIRTCVRAYRERIAAFAALPQLDLWYARIDEAALVRAVPGVAATIADVHRPGRQAQRLYERYVDEHDAPRIADRPPLIFHPDDAEFVARARDAYVRYAASLASDLRTLVARFGFVDAAYKVVGIGSVGTRCAVLLVRTAQGDPLFLQLKEARASVYARYGCANPYANEAERVVAGQRLMQATSDAFLGWTPPIAGHVSYVRQLRDVKTGVDLDTIGEADLARYASLCGWALARAHAKASGEPALIAGYLGTNDSFDEAMLEFSTAYARQNEADHAALLRAIASGRIAA